MFGETAVIASEAKQSRITASLPLWIGTAAVAASR